MVEKFDAYYEWLSIPPDEQPPNHYRLLGIQPFEGNPDFISNAAEQRTVYLRTFQIGTFSADSQKLLNEVAAAKVCLLNPVKKAEYDQALRKQPGKGPPTGDEVEKHAERRTSPPAVADETIVEQRSAAATPVKKVLPVTPTVLGASAACGLTLVGLIAWLLIGHGKPAAQLAPQANPPPTVAATLASAATPPFKPKPMKKAEPPAVVVAPPVSDVRPTVVETAPAPAVPALDGKSESSDLATANRSQPLLGERSLPPEAKPEARPVRPEPETTPQVDAEHRAAQWVLNRGGHVVIQVGQESRVIGPAGQLPPSPWVISGVRMQRIKDLDDADLVNLADLNDVEEVLFTGDNLTGIGCRHLAGLPKLRHLVLVANPIINQGLAQIGKLSQVRSLNLHGCARFTEVGLEHLAAMKDLTALDLGLTNTNDKGLSHLGGLTNLVTLILPHTKVTDAGLLHLKGLHNLKSLNVAKTKVTARGVHLLKTCLPKCEIHE